MPYTLNRPAADFDSGSGLLVAEHFQVAYTTNDFERALDVFRKRLGIRDFAELGGELPDGGQIRAAFAWVGTTMYEIIWATGPGSALYMDRLPAGDDLVVRLHHLGFLIQSQDQWDAAIANAERAGYAIAQRGVNPLVEVAFVDVPELGHYLEYLYATPLGLEFFENVPRT